MVSGNGSGWEQRGREREGWKGKDGLGEWIEVQMVVEMMG